MRLVYQFQDQKVKGQVTVPINADTDRAPNGKAYELQTWCTDGGWWPALATGAMTSKVKGQGHKITWSVWAVLAEWPINRKWIVVVSPKLTEGYPMTRATLRTSFKVKRSKVRVGPTRRPHLLLFLADSRRRTITELEAKHTPVHTSWRLQ